jgi:hypothetical protein
LETLQPALAQARDQALELADSARDLAERWRPRRPDDVLEDEECLTEESESLCQAVHLLYCAWHALHEGFCAAKADEQRSLRTLYERTRTALDLLRLRFEQEDIRPVLAVSWDYLNDLRRRFPPKSDVHTWWLLCERLENGVAARAYKSEGEAAERNAESMEEALGVRRRKAARTAEQIPETDWGRRYRNLPDQGESRRKEQDMLPYIFSKVA